MTIAAIIAILVLLYLAVVFVVNASHPFWYLIALLYVEGAWAVAVMAGFLPFPGWME